MVELFKVHYSGCKVCHKEEHYSTSVHYQEHDSHSDSFTHEYERPNPIRDIIVAAFSLTHEIIENESNSYLYPIDSSKFVIVNNVYWNIRNKIHFTERPESNSFGNRFQGMNVSYVDEEHKRHTIQVHLKDGCVDLDKVRGAVEKAEVALEEVFERQNKANVERTKADDFYVTTKKIISEFPRIEHRVSTVSHAYIDKLSFTITYLTHDQLRAIMPLLDNFFTNEEK